MILEDPKPGNPWDPWRHGVPHALLIGAATALGAKLAEWAVDSLKARIRGPKKTARKS